MTTFVTFKNKKDKTPHYCDRRYGEAVCNRFYYMKDLSFLRSLPFWSLLRGVVNSFSVPEDATYLCNGMAELYAVYYRRSKADTITMIKELFVWDLPGMPEGKREFIIKVLSASKGLITDTNMMKRIIEKYLDIRVEVCNPFCAQPFLENKQKLDTKNILFVGAHSPNKGYLQLIDAFKILREADKEWDLYMLGSCAERIREQTDGMHVLGYVPDLKSYLSKCSIYVHPAYFEPFGITVLEAMSAGLMPIVTKTTGVSEVLEKNSLSKLVVNSNEPEILAKKILEVQSYSTEKKKRISDKCKKVIKEGYLELEGVEKFRRAFYRICG